MNSKEYIRDACKTESINFPEIRERLSNEFQLRLLHGSMGICTEAGELQDALKKFIFYGKDLDLVNLKEEVGDLFWYVAILCDDLKVDFEELWKTNIEKLKSRYPNKFDKEKAVNRDLVKEREILESGT